MRYDFRVCNLPTQLLAQFSGNTYISSVILSIYKILKSARFDLHNFDLRAGPEKLPVTQRFNGSTKQVY